MPTATTRKPRSLEARRYYKSRGAALALWRNTNAEVIISGPAGTGKSRACLEKVHACCLRWPGTRALVVRKTRESLTESALVTFESCVVPANDPLLAGTQRRMRQSYRYANGSEIVVGGMDKPSKVMSTEYDLIYIQEAIELFEDDWESLTTRLRHGVMPFQQILGDTNPDAPTHWLRRRADAGRCVMLEIRHEDNPVMWDEARGGWTDVGRAYIAKLDALTGARLDRLRYGRWVAAEGVVYDEWDRRKHLISTAPDPRLVAHASGRSTSDINNAFVCIWVAIDPRRAGLPLPRDLPDRAGRSPTTRGRSRPSPGRSASRRRWPTTTRRTGPRCTSAASRPRRPPRRSPRASRPCSSGSAPRATASPACSSSPMPWWSETRPWSRPSCPTCIGRGVRRLRLAQGPGRAGREGSPRRRQQPWHGRITICRCIPRPGPPAAPAMASGQSRPGPEYPGSLLWIWGPPMSDIEVIHGDCLDRLRGIPDGSVDAVIADPPYSSGGLMRGDRTASTNSKYVRNSAVGMRGDFDGDTRDGRSWLYWCALWIKECLRIVKPGGYFLMFSDWRQVPTATDAIQCGGFVWRGIITWDKGRGARAAPQGALSASMRVYRLGGHMGFPRWPIGAAPGMAVITFRSSRVTSTTSPESRRDC